MSVSSAKELLGEVRREKQKSRRGFLKTVGFAGAGIVGGGALAGCGGASGLSLSNVRASSSSSSPTDADILNFALNLEYLEAEFYTYATTGNGIGSAGIATSGTGNSGVTSGGMKISFPDDEHHDIFVNVTSDEQAHVTLLRSALGSAAVAKPAIDLNALGLGFGSFIEFINLARAFEDVGITAYAGAAPLISNKMYLGVAARILATEGEHSGNIRDLVILYEADDAPSAKAIGKLDSVDIPPTDGIYFSVNYEGLVETRTPAQVLAILYHGSGKTSGAFFPSGVNGAITSS
ncbi:MAG: ferritin-like domain-containing protein [Terriglobales bacterium]